MVQKLLPLLLVVPFAELRAPESEIVKKVLRLNVAFSPLLALSENIFQAENPAAMCQAVGKVVHEGFSDKDAFAFYQDVKNSFSVL